MQAKEGLNPLPSVEIVLNILGIKLANPLRVVRKATGELSD
jgi:hypothetical protein